MSRLSGKRNGIMSSRVWAMTGSVAQWIRQRLIHNIVETVGGSGEGSWGSIGASMQSDVIMANQTENQDRSAVRPSVPCFLDQFVPERTEVMLWSRKSIAYVELGKCPHKPKHALLVGMDSLARDVDQDGK